MADDCVSWPEMRWINSQPDPVDAVLNGDSEGDDLLEVAAIVHDLRSAFAPVEPLERRHELAVFTGEAPNILRHPVLGAAALDSSSVDPPDPTPHGRKRSSMLSSLGGFVGTLTGKVVLGTAVAAASVGGLHAADAVDVPALPDNAQAEQHDPDKEPASDKADAGAEGKETADANKSAADAYTDAVKDWTDCVSEAASAQGDEATRTTGGFDPREGCGERPEPAEFGLNDLPSQAADAAEDARSERTSNAGGEESPGSGAPDSRPTPDDTPAGPPSTVPDTPAADNAPSPGGSRP